MFGPMPNLLVDPCLRSSRRQQQFKQKHILQLSNCSFASIFFSSSTYCSILMDTFCNGRYKHILQWLYYCNVWKFECKGVGLFLTLWVHRPNNINNNINRPNMILKENSAVAVAMELSCTFDWQINRTLLFQCSVLACGYFSYKFDLYIQLNNINLMLTVCEDSGRMFQILPCSIQVIWSCSIV